MRAVDYGNERERKRWLVIVMGIDYALDALGMPEPFGITDAGPVEGRIDQRYIDMKHRGHACTITVIAPTDSGSEQFSIETAQRLIRAWQSVHGQIQRRPDPDLSKIQAPPSSSAVAETIAQVEGRPQEG
jgi:hypothetical protein